MSSKNGLLKKLVIFIIMIKLHILLILIIKLRSFTTGIVSKITLYKACSDTLSVSRNKIRDFTSDRLTRSNSSREP